MLSSYGILKSPDFCLYGKRTNTLTRIVQTATAASTVNTSYVTWWLWCSVNH